MRKIGYLLVFLVLVSCSKTDKYDSMHFVRAGGGQIDFTVYETGDANQLKVMISKYNFRDTIIQIYLLKEKVDETAFSTFHSAMNKVISLKGDFEQSIMATGTWVHIYFSSNGKELEVTNKALRNSLLKFEELTLSQIN